MLICSVLRLENALLLFNRLAFRKYVLTLCVAYAALSIWEYRKTLERIQKNSRPYTGKVLREYNFRLRFQVKVKSGGLSFAHAAHAVCPCGSCCLIMDRFHFVMGRFAADHAAFPISVSK